jgi:hypothetical protein
VDILLAELRRLRLLHIFTFPPVRIRLASPRLEEFGLFTSDLTQIVELDLPALRRLHVQADFKTLVIRDVREDSFFLMSGIELVVEILRNFAGSFISYFVKFAQGKTKNNRLLWQPRIEQHCE